MDDFTNRWPPQQHGAASFKRMLGASRRNRGPPRRFQTREDPDDCCANRKEEWSEKRERHDQVKDVDECTDVPSGAEEEELSDEANPEPWKDGDKPPAEEPDPTSRANVC